MSDRSEKSGFPWPHPHLMGLAPLDVWVRLLWGGGRRGKIGGGWRYLPRVLFALITSFISTIVTFPERVVLAPVLWFKGRDPKIAQEAVIITGYYRSGTTHLHNLMSCDRGFVTPRWAQAMAPQGWVVSWLMLRLAMLPFAPNRRPQDAVPFGPWWPAEDDFALANWGLASPLPGRFVFPSQRERWARWHDLEGLTEKELGRWRRTLAGFCWKIGVLSPSKSLLLKTPSHTARVRELDRLFAGRVRFVHVVRDEGAVVRSNVKMQERFERYGLEDGVDGEQTAAAIKAELVRTERLFEEQSEELDDGRVVRVAYDRLAADPVGTVRGVYDTLGLEWSEKVERAVGAYAASVSGYSAENSVPRESSEDAESEKAVPSLTFGAPTDRVRAAGWVVVPLVAAGCLGVWLGIGWATGERFDSLVWLWGVVIGWCGLVVGRRGSRGLGMWCGLWVLVVVAAAVWPMPEVSAGWTGVDRIKNIRTAYLTKPTSVHVMLVFGVVTAMRIGSREHARPPGR